MESIKVNNVVIGVPDEVMMDYFRAIKTAEERGVTAFDKIFNEAEHVYMNNVADYFFYNEKFSKSGASFHDDVLPELEKIRQSFFG